MEWKNKLYDHEVIPPENVWNKIVQDLDNDHIIFKEKLQHVAITPPDNTWNRITQDLDNDYLFFKEKLQHSETTPPVHVWHKIVQDLDNDYLLFKEKLQYAETNPPAGAWNNIQSLLDETPAQKTRVTGLPFILRIAAAAAVIGILFFTADYFLNNHKQENDTAVKQTTSPKTPVNNNTTTAPKIADAQPVKEKKYIASTYNGKKQQAGGNEKLSEEFYSDGETYTLPSPELIVQENTPITDQYDINTGFNKRVRNLQGEIKEDVTLLDLPNSYFLMTGPDGQAVRVSSKFRNTIQYLNGSGGEELLDVILRESQYWKSIFTDWKQKVNNSTFIPSATNFMDIAELMQLFQQNTRK